MTKGVLSITTLRKTDGPTPLQIAPEPLLVIPYIGLEEIWPTVLVTIPPSSAGQTYPVPNLVSGRVGPDLDILFTPPGPGTYEVTFTYHYLGTNPNSLPGLYLGTATSPAVQFEVLP
jgi:hypothetical protein